MGSVHIWKLLHLLNTYGPELPVEAIRRAGYDCAPDTYMPLVLSGAVEALPSGRQYYNADAFKLSNAAAGVLQNCLVGYRNSIERDLRVGEHSVFVVMPFSETWSYSVYERVMAPACSAAGLACVRGDKIDRSQSLLGNILQAICDAGVVVVDISAPNLNVYYELGLCHAIGKDVRIIKQVDSKLPADLAGVQYIEYSLPDGGTGAQILSDQLVSWANLPSGSAARKSSSGNFFSLPCPLLDSRRTAEITISMTIPLYSPPHSPSSCNPCVIRYPSV